MSSVKLVLRKKINPDKTLPIAIRITKDRKSSFIYTGQNVKENEWDSINQRVKKSHPNSARLNNYLLAKLSEANDKLLELQTQKEIVSSKTVKKKLKPTAGATFSSQAELYINTLKESGKYNRVSAEQPRINRFKEFLKSEDIIFEDISVGLLNRFKAYLQSTRTISQRTIINHLMVIRSVFSQAIKNNVVDAKYYPFGRDKIRIKFPDSIKIGLTADEVKAIEELNLEPNSDLNHARNIWLFSFYFAGMRVSDVLRLKWSDFQDDRLHYSMGKNLKGGSFKVSEKAQRILDQYKSTKSPHNLVFHYLENAKDFTDSYEVQQKISYAVKRINASLKEIAVLAKVNKQLTMHISRHTFGNLSGDKISIQMLQKLYRHSSVTTTIGYQANFIHRDTDDALNSVIGF